MSKSRLTVVVLALIAVHWLIATIPALIIAAFTVITVTAVFAALIVWRTRAERAIVTAWKARKAATS